ncbi:NADH-quinone oxidoreductase subunit C [Photobacterium proteolyticum]|nr:NADH-quinone oxidoreductase subunit C [Photobacterium proteolyticum]
MSRSLNDNTLSEHIADLLNDTGMDGISLDASCIDMPTLVVPPKKLITLCQQLKQDPKFKFNFLSDIGGVDFLGREPRFEVVYHLFSIELNHRIRLKCPLAEGATIPTVSKIWSCADWHEREAFDMFGIVFSDHPSLKRIYMDDDFKGFPLRKDFPVRGYQDDLNPFGEPEPEGDN